MGVRIRGRFYLFAGAAISCMAMSSAALAQDAAEAPAPASNGEGGANNASSGSPGDIIVTARRREEPLQRVPVAVSAYGAEELASKRINTKEDLAVNTPSMITVSGGGPRELSVVALRGQGPTFGSIPGVITYFAEVPAARTVDGRDGTYLDLANVQVLSGPQGTLFGKNATGGNVMFTPAPPTDRFEGYVQAEFGNYNNNRLEGAINIPLAGGARLRIAAAHGHRDGYTHDVGPVWNGRDYDDLNYDTIRATLVLEPFEGFTTSTIARYYHASSNGPGTVLEAFNPDASVSGNRILDFFPSMATAVADQAALGTRHVAFDGYQYSKTRYWQIINTSTLDLTDNIALKNIVSYSELRVSYGYDYDGTTNSIAGQGDPANNEVSPNVVTEELQLQGTAFQDALQFSLGGYYDKQTVHRHETSLFDYFPLSFFLGQRFRFYTDPSYDSHALFAQGTLDLGKLTPSLDGFSFTAGYRYTWDHAANETRVHVFPIAAGSADFKYGSYTLTLNYQATPNLLLYASNRSAYKAGGVNGPVPEGSPFRTYPPEKITDVELGLKSQFILGDIRGRANIAAYRGTYDNIQRTTQELVGQQILNVVRSAAKGRVQGVEFDGQLSLSGFTLNGSASYTDSKYTKVTDSSANAILQGSAFPFTPKWKYTANGRYDFALADSAKGYVSAQYVYQGKFSTAQTNQVFTRYLPGYGLLNLRAGVDNAFNQPIDVALFATNVTNKDYKIGVFDAYNQGFGFVTFTYGEPRMFGLQMKYRFGS